MATLPTNGTVNHQDHASSTSSGNEQSGDGHTISKDEVGWYFVEQYYTTLSKNPERLHLFYGKHSQFVYGLETEVAPVSVGRQPIADRIKELDLRELKVRVSNVDSQASMDNIVIQVIGETVNKGSDEAKKFVQTFVLAKQPSGYFVLNDILRYINDENEEETGEAAAPADPEPAAETTAAAEIETAQPEAEAPKEETPEEKVAVVPAQLDAAVVNKKLEEAVGAAKETPSTSSVNTPAEVAAPAKEATATPAKVESAAPAAADPEKVAQEITEEEAKKSETPKDPTPTPAAPRATAPVVAEPEKPKEAPKMTWASRIAAAAGPPRPVVALPKTATPVVVPASRPAAPAAAATAAPQAAVPAVAAEATPAAKDSPNEWQTAGSDSKRQSRPQPAAPQAQEREGTLGYVKYVTDKVQTDNLRAALAAHGALVYFDINRGKNCAFVEFDTPSAYQSAAAASPFTVDGEQIILEPRRPKNAYGGAGYNRGSISGRGRGGFDGSRSGGSRGAFNGPPRGGRGGGATRGRGGPSQPPNA